MTQFQDLYQHYAQDVYRFAYWLCGDPAEAEDIVSETFVRAWVHFDEIRTETVKAFLFTIARNLYLKGQRHTRRSTSLDLNAPDATPGPERAAETNLELETARVMLQQFPEIDRAAFIMRVQDELPYEEIARALNLTLSAVKVKVHRVRLKLAERRVR